MDNPEKLATKGTQDEGKQNIYTTNDFWSMWKFWLIHFCYQTALCHLWSINRLQRET